MAEVYIFGAGGLGKEMAWHLEMLHPSSQAGELVGFVDDDESRWHTDLYGYPVLGRLEDVVRPGALVLLAMGRPRHRASGFRRIKRANAVPFSVVGPAVVRARTARCGAGTVLEYGAILGPDTVIGDAVLVNKRAIISHDAHVGDYCVLSPNVFLSGGSRVADGCDVGAGATLIPGVSVGRGCVIGAGAVVTRDLPPFSLAVGVPAVIRKRLPAWDTEELRTAEAIHR